MLKRFVSDLFSSRRRRRDADAAAALAAARDASQVAYVSLEYATETSHPLRAKRARERVREAAARAADAARACKDTKYESEAAEYAALADSCADAVGDPFRDAPDRRTEYVN